MRMHRCSLHVNSVIKMAVSASPTLGSESGTSNSATRVTGQELKAHVESGGRLKVVLWVL